jgi:hypothetical protein
MKKYYAKVNDYASEISHGFGNTWSVYVFDSKKGRDRFVANDYRINTKAINKSEVTNVAANWDMGRNEYSRPRPFTRDYWGIDEWCTKDIYGFIGIVSVCNDGTMPRLFS